jgi:Cu(I)/Ag(I) efflux system membrane fusion protein
MLLVLTGCEGSRASRAAVEPTPAAPRLVRQNDGTEWLEVSPGKIPGMSEVEVRRVELPALLETTGQVAFDDQRTASIISRVNGRIEETEVSLWDVVKKGEPVLHLYSPDFMTAEAEYLQAAATANVSSGPGFGDGGKLAAEMFSAARRKLELLGLEPSDIRAIRAPSPTVIMRAPIGGTVVEKKVVRGQQVNAGDVLFSLGTLQDVWITGDIFESDVARVHEGQELEAEVASYPGETFRGTVERISPNVDPSSHTIQIRCSVANKDLKLKPQMLARVRITTQPGAALVVPQEALVFDTDSYYAFVVVSPERVTRRKVSVTSWNERGYARVLSGLEPGEQIVQGESLQMNALWHQAHGESS